MVLNSQVRYSIKASESKSGMQAMDDESIQAYITHLKNVFTSTDASSPMLEAGNTLKSLAPCLALHFVLIVKISAKILEHVFR